jgi:hypothetical protein
MTTHTFSGHSSQETDTFTIGAHWRILWSCEPAADDKAGYLVVIEVDAPDGSVVDSGVSTMCQQNNTSGTYELYGGDYVSLKIISIGEWQVQVQEWQEVDT